MPKTGEGVGGCINPEKVGKEQLSYYWFRVKGTRMAVKQEDEELGAETLSLIFCYCYNLTLHILLFALLLTVELCNANIG